ncbi:hypothetical protein ACFFWC_21835 [Plantactinospora siamensis]|uniref:Nucleotidyltransferase n=1 Tax=Plantactinospora siamensis TaxID=555372 RepID=A0ABV6P5B2_9ACTN
MSEMPLGAILDAARRALDSAGVPGVRAALLWGSIIDVIEATVPYDPGRDVDVLVVCENTEKVKFPQRNFGGMPSSIMRSSSYTLDVFFADVSYVVTALRNQRWTVTRGILSGPVVRDDGSLSHLRELCVHPEPFTLTGWEDWLRQSQSLLLKAARLIAEGNYGYADLLLRDALNTFSYAMVFKESNGPPTPTSFPWMFEKRFGASEIYRFFHDFHGISEIGRDAVQQRFLALSEIFSSEART